MGQRHHIQLRIQDALIEHLQVPSQNEQSSAEFPLAWKLIIRQHTIHQYPGLLVQERFGDDSYPQTEQSYLQLMDNTVDQHL